MGFLTHRADPQVHGPAHPRPRVPADASVRLMARPPVTAPLRRAALACTAAVVVVVGLLARTGLPGAPGDASGGILYAALVYLVLAFVLPGAPLWRVGGAAVVVCFLVEFFQLTPYPALWGNAWHPLRLVFGTTFNAWDLPAYAAGAAAALLGDGLLSRTGTGGGRRDTSGLRAGRGGNAGSGPPGNGPHG